MQRKSNTKKCIFLAYVIFFCNTIYGAVFMDTIVSYYVSNCTSLLQTTLINNETGLNSLLKSTKYDSTDCIKKLERQPDFNAVTVFSFVGWPCEIDSITEGNTDLRVEYKLKGYTVDTLLVGSRPSDIMAVYTIPKTTKLIKFVNNTKTSIKLRNSHNNKSQSIGSVSESCFDLSGRQLRRFNNKKLLIEISKNGISKKLHIK